MVSAPAIQIFADPPQEKYETVGVVRGFDIVGFTPGQRHARATREMLRRAAEIGANAVILKSSSYNWPQQTVEGTAIKILPKADSAH